FAFHLAQSRSRTFVPATRCVATRYDETWTADLVGQAGEGPAASAGSRPTRTIPPPFLNFATLPTESTVSPSAAPVPGTNERRASATRIRMGGGAEPYPPGPRGVNAKTASRQHDQLAAHVGGMQLADDREYPLLVGGELDLLRLTTRDHLGDVVRGDGEAVLVRVGGDVVDELQLHLGALLHDRGRRHPDLASLVLDVDDGEVHLVGASRKRVRADEQADRRRKADHESPHVSPPWSW